MKPTKFGNKKALQIVSNDMINNIKNTIKSLSNMDIFSRYYGFLNEKNIHLLREGKYKISVNTFGYKYLLFLTKIDDKKYSIFINKKREDMIYIIFNFKDDLYNDTLLDGELIKNNKDEWIYVINDIFLYKGENILRDRNLSTRRNILSEIINNHFQIDKMDVCKMEVKELFSIEYIEDIYQRYIKTLPYKVSGLFIQDENNFKKSFMYIFPECRTIKDNAINKNNLGNLDSVNTEKKMDNNSKNEDKDKIEDKMDKIDEIKIKRKYMNFQIENTEFPDIYELYCYDKNNKVIKLGYASVPDIETSKFLIKIFEKEDNKKIVKCEFSEAFNKWIPKKLIDGGDMDKLE